VSVFAELNQLESVLSRISPDENMRAGITRRLQEMLSRWTSAQRPTGKDVLTSTLRSATADEVLEFIDKEFGVS
jgi:pimaricinolide synthase PimS1